MRLADRLTQLLEGRQIIKALEVIKERRENQSR